MKIKNVMISNLDDYFHYVQEKKSIKSDISDASAHTMVFDKLKITLEMEDVTPIEILSLKKWCNKLFIVDYHICDREDLESYQLADDYLDTLDDMKNFIGYIDKDEDLNVGWLYDVLINCRFKIICTLNLDTINYLFEVNMDKIFDKNGELMDEKTYEEELDTIYNKFVQVFANKLYKGLPQDLKRYDICVENFLSKEYFLSTMEPDIKLVKCISPFGGCLNFTKNYPDIDKRIEYFSKNLKIAREYDADDETMLYFGVTSTFYTMFNLITHCGFDADYDLKNEFILGNQLYLDNILLERYQNRMDNYLGPILQEEAYSIQNNDNNIAFTTLLCPANTIMKYCLKVKLSDISRIDEIDNFEIGGDFEVIWEQVKKSLHIIDATIKK